MNGAYSMRASLPEQNHAVVSRVRSRGDSDGYEHDGRFLEAEGTILRATGLDPSGAGEASSSCSTAGLDNETVILSLRERVRWLEQRLCEKDEEVVMLQEQVSLLQHQMGLDRPAHGSTEEASSGSRHGAQGASSSLPADESGSGFSTSGVDTSQHPRSTKGMAGITIAPGNHPSASNGNGIPAAGGASSNGDVNRKWHLANAGDKTNSSSHAVKVDVKAPVPIKTRSMDGSRPPRIIPAAPGTLATGIEETSSSYSTTLSATSPGITRPTSAPGLVASQRPGNHFVPTLHAQPPLSRSLSAAGRLVLGAESPFGVHSNGHIDASPPVSPSYRNAAAGRIKSSGGLASYAVPSSANIHSGGSGMTTSSAYMTTAPSHGGAPSAFLSAPTASAASPPSTPSKMPAGPAQVAKTEISPSSTPGSLQPAVVSQGLPEVLSTQENSQIAAGGRRSPVGIITFGTVTPEVLHQQQDTEEPEHLHRQQKGGEQAQPQFPTLAPHQQESLESRKQQQQQQQDNLVFQDGLSRHLSHGQQAYQRSVHSSLLHENGLLSAGRHNMMSLMESVNNGGAMGEEFPHLDIINDLLEDDQGCFGLALNTMAQQAGSVPFSNNRHLSMAMPKHNQYGQLHSDSSNEPSDRGRTGSDDDRLHMHEGNHGNMRDNRRMAVAFSHQSLGRLQSQHSSHLDNMYWPITSAGIPAASNARNGGLDTHMGYPLVQSHHVQDCSGFSLAHNGYSVYAPAQQP